MATPVRSCSPWIVALLLIGLTALPAAAQFVLRDDLTGGDCAPAGGGIGRWDAAKKSCTLTANLQGTIELGANGLTLDGAGHKLSPRVGDTVGILASGRRKSIVANLVVDAFAVGIRIVGGGENRIERVTVTGGPKGAHPFSCGIHLDSTERNRVTKCTVEKNKEIGICLESSSWNQIYDNRIRFQVEHNVWLSGSTENQLARNWIAGDPADFVVGIELVASDDNLIAANEIDNHQAAGIANTISNRTRIFFNTFRDNLNASVEIGTSQDVLVSCNDSTGAPDAIDLGAGSTRNTIWMNNFFANDGARDRGGAAPPNRFDLAPPRGGNHWAKNAQFCVDANGDGFCDAPFLFIGNQDNLPWVNPVPWRLQPELCLGPPAPPPPPEQQLPPIDVTP